MFSKRLPLIVSVIFLLTPIYACTDTDKKKESAVFKEQTELLEVRPKRPVKIKLKRNAKGSYSWYLKGSDVDEIIKADKNIRKSLETEK